MLQFPQRSGGIVQMFSPSTMRRQREETEDFCPIGLRRGRDISKLQESARARTAHKVADNDEQDVLRVRSELAEADPLKLAPDRTVRIELAHVAIHLFRGAL